MKTIWKFPLEITDGQTIVMPEGAEILNASTKSVSHARTQGKRDGVIIRVKGQDLCGRCAKLTEKDLNDKRS